MIEPGTIFVPRNSKRGKGQPRVVVFRIGKNGSVHYDSLIDGGGGLYHHGPGSSARFLEEWEPVGKMTFGGAWQMYRKEKYKGHKVRAAVQILWEALTHESEKKYAIEELKFSYIIEEPQPSKLGAFLCRQGYHKKPHWPAEAWWECTRDGCDHYQRTGSR